MYDEIKSLISRFWSKGGVEGKKKKTLDSLGEAMLAKGKGRNGVFQDPWLPRPLIFRRITTPRADLDDMSVSSLIMDTG